MLYQMKRSNPNQWHTIKLVPDEMGQEPLVQDKAVLVKLCPVKQVCARAI
uniref:Uncharacterized protein n=1 Tax=Picea glauca TaxID=3330 RepID=A0A117NJ20_PICGL|nr:hypothetical protein ABT39_MTgene672 [Picea glauca]QHR90929.1 hypothetical protein Q903MT_gene4958 [Picea sitchensis]